MNDSLEEAARHTFVVFGGREKAPPSRPAARRGGGEALAHSSAVCDFENVRRSTANCEFPVCVYGSRKLEIHPPHRLKGRKQCERREDVSDPCEESAGATLTPS